MKEPIRIGILTISEINGLFQGGLGLQDVADQAGVSLSKLYSDLRKHGYKYHKFGRLEPLQARHLNSKEVAA